MPRGRKRAEEQQDVQMRPVSKRHRSDTHRPPGAARRTAGFSEKMCLEWFREYTTADEPDLLGPEGMEQFCRDIRVDPENIVMLIIAWKMNAKSMGFFTTEEWVHGLSQLQADCAETLCWRKDYMLSLLNNADTFKSIYRFGFDFARDRGQRSVDLATGSAMVRLLLHGRWSLCDDFLQYLSHSNNQVINKDQWNNILEFSRTVDVGMSNYDENGAWPVMLDEFVEWQRRQARPDARMEPV